MSTSLIGDRIDRAVELWLAGDIQGYNELRDDLVSKGVSSDKIDHVLEGAGLPQAEQLKRATPELRDPRHGIPLEEQARPRLGFVDRVF